MEAVTAPTQDAGAAHMVVVPDYLDRRINTRIDEIVDDFPDVDRAWLRNEMLIQALTYDIPPEAVSIAPTAQKDEEL